MNVLDHYIELRLRYRDTGEDQPLCVGLEELADALFCSLRNVKRLLKSMEAEGLISWTSGGGRGKRSKLEFRRTLCEVFPPYFKQLLRQGRMKEATQVLKRDGVPADVRRSCYQQLMQELSLPRIRLRQEDLTKDPMKRPLKPTIVATETGRWLFVQGDEDKEPPAR